MTFLPSPLTALGFELNIYPLSSNGVFCSLGFSVLLLNSYFSLYNNKLGSWPSKVPVWFSPSLDPNCAVKIKKPLLPSPPPLRRETCMQLVHSKHPTTPVPPTHPIFSLMIIVIIILLILGECIESRAKLQHIPVGKLPDVESKPGWSSRCYGDRHATHLP